MCEEGLAVEDFELIQEGAVQLQEMSAAAKWRVTNDAIYREHSNDFQKIAKRLSRTAGRSLSASIPVARPSS